MMKTLLTLFSMSMCFVLYAQDTSPEISPDLQPEVNTTFTQVNSTNALFSPLQITDITATVVPTGAMVGCRWIASLNEYWVSEWNTAQFYSLDAAGNLITAFTIPGVTGIRSITTDGTNVYLGTSLATINVVNPATKTLTSTIAINVPNASAGTESRMCAYDPNLDNGAGGFWIGDFGSDIASINMSGNELSVIPSATHGAATYGGDVDYVSPGGPFLWISDQTVINGSRANLKQLQLPAGTPTGVVYDFYTDALPSTTPVGTNPGEAIAGSLFISDEINAGFHVLAGVFQSNPRQLFVLELEPQTASVDDTIRMSFTMGPNPAQEFIELIIKNPKSQQKLTIYDVTGKLVLSKNLRGLEYRHIIDINALTSGIYIAQLSSENSQVTRKLIKN
jgi:hypothetical protein